ncbi:16S rRNA (cytosine(967)-C(5))-methyltransferase RsmB [Wenzhouxiangella sp. XN79A]|uniref:16S rRNA (cytosine(967)-C(5))-methyltransferase RsmB n=1 Tax=Wenzhouxiangella sp. XN79A TaxID=2724193 RepID=UPI00144AE1F5|nr:16S rRNA (cytosine(967)-C(5))-methyltransferase RsmB [Wenzhouxiangella sp. XN79A]NKI35855.1 16S rRNA (cytosine(967)-C(5))-methyltransferase RsmB [Wenzhouxiangella sp. XN79A]
MAATGARPRLAAAHALTEVLDRGRALTDALDGLGDRLDASRDRAQVRRLCNRVLRNWPALDARVRARLRKPLARRNRWIHFLLAIAVDELDDAREPAPAVVHAAVEAVRAGGAAPMAGLVNAVLRTELRAPPGPEPGDDDVLRYGMPGWLARRIRTDWPDDADAILAAGNRPPPTWLRVNRRRTTVEAARAALEAAGLPCTVDARLPDAIRLERPAAIGQLPGFREGHLSVQDAGAQVAVDLLDLAAGQRVLDACAAPGGKAAHILERADVELLAIDRDAARTRRIETGWARLGLSGRAAVADAARPDPWWDGRPFDRILVDAPCSATGVLRRHPDVRWLRREADIEANAAIQDAILEALWSLLRPGGLLVYATCSILHAENRDRGRKFLERQSDAEPVAFELPETRAVDPGRQILPGSLDRDGFYYLVLRRLPADGA